MSDDQKDVADQQFQRELAEASQAAEALKARRQFDAGGPDAVPRPRTLAEELHLTVPPPEAQAIAETYWRDQHEQAIRRARDAEVRRRETRSQTVAGKLPPGFAWAAFGATELTARVRSRRAIAEAQSALDEPRVVLTGTAGAGKTSVAAAMLRARFVLRGGAFAFEPAWHLAIARSRHPLGQGEPDVVTKAIDAEILVIDDLGNEKVNPSSAVDDIVFERHWAARATWVTTSKSLKEIGERYGDGIARRLFEGAIIIDCDGRDGR